MALIKLLGQLCQLSAWHAAVRILYNWLICELLLLPALSVTQNRFFLWLSCLMKT